MIKEINIAEKYNPTPLVIALGFFDCVHLGHVEIIEETKKLAKEYGAESAITTFANDPGWLLGKMSQIYTKEERKFIFESLGVQNLLYAYFNEEFADISPSRAAQLLTDFYNIKALVCGKDFTYGKNAEGNVDTLTEFMSKKSIPVIVIPYVKLGSKKLSTTTIKKMIQEGNVEMANECMPKPYFLIGTVVHGAHRGTNLGYPTANLSLHPNCIRPCEGVYITKVYLDGKAYLASTNVGAKPSLDDNNFTIESYILDFGQNIYGKEIRVEFYKRLRGTIRFNSLQELKKQLADDVKATRDYFAQTEK